MDGLKKVKGKKSAGRTSKKGINDEMKTSNDKYIYGFKDIWVLIFK